jgi:hypothetical protein
MRRMGPQLAPNPAFPSAGVALDPAREARGGLKVPQVTLQILGLEDEQSARPARTLGARLRRRNRSTYR